MKLVDQIKAAESGEFVDKRGKRTMLRLNAPMTRAELAEFETLLPCPMPPDFKELLEYCSGFELDFVDGIFNDHTNRIYFEPLNGIGDLVAHCVEIAQDDSGNRWIVEITHGGPGPVFYVNHDPPIFSYQSSSLSHFFEELFKLGNRPWTSDVLVLWGELSRKIYDQNPNVLSWDLCVNSHDSVIRTFAESLDDGYYFIDMRAPSIGDGFNPCRYGADTICKRHTTERIFAVQKRKLTWLQKIFGA